MRSQTSPLAANHRRATILPKKRRASYELGVGLTSGEVVGISEGVGDALPVAEGNSVGVGKAKVGSGEGEAIGDSLGEGVTLGDETGVGDGVGVGVGIKSAQ